MALLMDTPLPLSAVAQTRPSASANAAPRHLDPRVSLAVLVAINVQMALTQSLFAEMGVLALTVVVMAYCRRFFAIVRWLAFYALFAVTAQLLVASGNTLLSPFAASLLMYRHVLPAFMFAFNMIATTRLGELACALQAMRVPANVSVAVCVAFRFLPTMGREFSAVVDAMKTRGIALTPRSVVRHPAKTAEYFLVPVIARLGQVADELGNAVVVRGVGASAHRTSYYRLRMCVVDVVCLIAATVLLVFAVCLRTGVLC